MGITPASMALGIAQDLMTKELDVFGYTFDGPIDNNPFVFIDKDFRFSWPS
jgi:hypothetical protein